MTSLLASGLVVSARTPPSFSLSLSVSLFLCISLFVSFSAPFLLNAHIVPFAHTKMHPHTYHICIYTHAERLFSWEIYTPQGVIYKMDSRFDDVRGLSLHMREDGSALLCLELGATLYDN